MFRHRPGPTYVFPVRFQVKRTDKEINVYESESERIYLSSLLNETASATSEKEN